MASLRITVLLAASVAAQIWSHCGYAQRPPLPGTGIFSSMRVSERSGDIVGMELYVVGGANGYYAIVQGSEGAPGTPVVLPLSVSGDVIEFAVPSACPCGLRAGRYRGSLTDAGVTLDGPGDFPPLVLARGDSFWQTFGRR